MKNYKKFESIYFKKIEQLGRELDQAERELSILRFQTIYWAKEKVLKLERRIQLWRVKFNKFRKLNKGGEY